MDKSPLERIERLEALALRRIESERISALTDNILGVICSDDAISEKVALLALEAARVEVRHVMKMREMTRRMEFSRTFWTTVSARPDSPTEGV